jgi:hypothetical protein
LQVVLVALRAASNCVRVSYKIEILEGSSLVSRSLDLLLKPDTSAPRAPARKEVADTKCERVQSKGRGRGA